MPRRSFSAIVGVGVVVGIAACGGTTTGRTTGTTTGTTTDYASQYPASFQATFVTGTKCMQIAGSRAYCDCVLRAIERREPYSVAAAAVHDIANGGFPPNWWSDVTGRCLGVH